jgi:hypothetical protein
MILNIPVGTSEPYDLELRDRGQAIVGTGFTVALDIKRKVNAAGETEAVSSPPTVAWLNQTAGTVRVLGLGSLPVATYLVRFSLTDGANKVGYCPNGPNADVWRVVPIPALP